MTTRVTVTDGKVAGYVTTAEYAELFGVKEGTVRQWINRKKLWALKIGTEYFVPEGTPKPGRKKKGQEAARRWFTFDLGVKQYYRIVIGLKPPTSLAVSPRIDVAGFMSSDVADSYINNVIRKHKEWDDEIMYAISIPVLLPPMTMDDQTLDGKIRMMNKISELSRQEHPSK